jgi:hypothetical protein
VAAFRIISPFTNGLHSTSPVHHAGRYESRKKGFLKRSCLAICSVLFIEWWV